MAALHVVCLNLEVGHRLGPALSTKLDVAVRLKGNRARSVFGDTDESGVDRTGGIVDNTLEQQIAGGVWCVVVLERTKVEHLIAVTEVNCVEIAVGAPTLKTTVRTHPGVVPTEGCDRRSEGALLADLADL